MQKFDHRSLIYGTIGTQEPFLNKQSKRVIRIRPIEVLLYIFMAEEILEQTVYLYY